MQEIKQFLSISKSRAWFQKKSVADVIKTLMEEWVYKQVRDN